MDAALFQPSAYARSWLQDSQASPELLARDPVMTMRDKLWVLRQRADAQKQTASAVWSAEHHARLEQGG